MAIAFVLVVPLVVILLLGPPESAEGVGRLFGTMLLPAVFGGLLGGWAARNSKRTWGWARYGLTVFALCFLFLIVVGVSSASQT